jgi:hypothetical protein
LVDGMKAVPESSMRIDVAEVGSGPPVVLVHSSVSGNRQWKKLAAQLSDRYRVVMPNLIGYGNTPAWHSERPMTLQDAAEAVLAVCAQLDGPIRLVGHSWGGAERPPRQRPCTPTSGVSGVQAIGTTSGVDSPTISVATVRGTHRCHRRGDPPECPRVGCRLAAD